MKKILIWLIPLLVVLLIVAGVLVAAFSDSGVYLGDQEDDDDDDDRPSVSQKDEANEDNGDNGDHENEGDGDEPGFEELLASIGPSGVVFEVKSNIGGTTAPLIAQVPNYTDLFLAASDEADFNEALANLIQNKSFTTVEYKGHIRATYEDGEVVYDAADAEEMIRDFVEQELIKAINAVTEKKEGQAE